MIARLEILEEDRTPPSAPVYIIPAPASVIPTPVSVIPAKAGI